MQRTMLQHAFTRREGDIEPQSLHGPEVQQRAFTHPVAVYILTSCPYKPTVRGEAWEVGVVHRMSKSMKKNPLNESRYLLLEFPVLTVQDAPQHVVELGCGCGSALLPILKVCVQSSRLQCILSSPLLKSPQLLSND